MHKDSYHEHLHNKQTNTTMSCIRNKEHIHSDMHQNTFLELPKKILVQSADGFINSTYLVYPPLSNSVYGPSHYLLCAFYFRETIALTDIDHVLLNMESAVIEPHTERRWPTCQSRTKCDIALQVDPLGSILWL